jgi:hypothetical protein
MNEPTRGIAAPAGSVVVHIERVVLDGFGFSAANGASVQRALEQELARLIAQAPRDARWHAGAAPTAAAPVVQMGGAPEPGRLGRDIAHSVFATLRNSP